MFKTPLRLMCALVASSVYSTGSIAQTEDVILEETVTVGSRGKPRSVTDSPAPIDVFSGSDFSNQGDTDVNNLLRNAVPSYNVNDQPISDAATLVRPANLRGLAPDHTLLLVNGKRRHRASVITWLGNGISNGSQGPDTAAIPALALQSVEVLRDGAAAQYGSDAIAGVMNFNLKNANEGGTIEVRYGQYSEGDGEQFTVAGNIGLPLGQNGFLNLTGEYGNSDPTSRSEQRADAQALIDAGFQGVPAPAMIWGRPIVDDDIKLWANFGFDLGGGTEIYGHTNYNTKTVDGGFFFRNPTNRGGVYAGNSDNGTPNNPDDDFASLLIADLTGNNTGNCPSGANAIPATVAGLASPELAAVAADPNCFHFSEIISGGFTPRFGGDVTDISFLFGVRGETEGGLLWDVSGYYGNHESDFFINNTVNASLGPDTPRDFNPGAYEQTDTGVNADFSYALSETINIAFGAEYRNEEFTISPGQEESFIDGGLGEQGFSTSSNGFPGFPVSTSGAFDRSNYAVYVDGEWDATEDLLLQAAVRFEDFEDFGTTTNFKVGGNYHFTDNFGARATFSTGFKAPTPGQTNASNTSTELTGGVLVNNGTIPATQAAILLQGTGVVVNELGPEDSTNYTIGVFFTVGNFDITVDYFDIDVEDRLNLSSEVELSDAQVQTLRDNGVAGAGDFTRFRYFTNDFDTNTSGVDIIVSTSTDWLGGTTDWNLAFNHTKTEVESFNADTIGPARIRQIEETTPDTRWNFSGNHRVGAFRFLARVSFYDEWFDSFENDVFGSDAVFDSEYLLDLEAAYDINESSSILIGGSNVLDNNGQKATDVNNIGSNSALVLGNTYSQYSPFGISGAYWYARYQYNF